MLAGPTGIGRTALLDAAIASAGQDVHVLHAVGTEAESDLAYGGLSALCRSLRPVVEQLRPASREVLSAALALPVTAVPAPGDIGLALLELLGAAAGGGPLLVVLDDHQWLDGPSRRALGVAVRRLSADPVCVLLGQRTGPVEDGELVGLPTVVLSPLDETAARRVLRDSAPTIAHPVVDTVLATAGGSPLLLHGLVRALIPAQLVGQEPVPDPLPVPAAAAGEVVGQLAGLPPGTLTALGVVAAEPSGELAVVRPALAAMDIDLDALAEAERRRVVTVGEGRVAFSTALLRSAAYHRLDRSLLRDAHRALADALPSDDVERRAWHLAEASADRDDAVAALLAEAGRRAAARGEPERAAAAWSRSGRLSTDPDRRDAALLAAAQQAMAAGHVEQARALAEQVERTSTEPRARGEARIIRARMTSLVGDPTTAFHAVRELVDADDVDAHLGTRLCIEAVALAFKAATTEAVPCARRAVQLAESTRDPQLQLRARLALAVAAALRGERPAPGALLTLVDQVLEHGAPVTDLAGLLTETALGLHATGRGEEGLALLSRVARAAHSARAVGVLPQVLLARADLENSLNRYGDAWTTAAEAAGLAERMGQHAVRRDLAFRLAALQALRGRTDEAREHYAEVLEHSSRDLLWLRARRGLGVLELGAGRPEAAAHSLEQLDAMARSLGRPDLSFGIYEHDLVLAHVQLGRRADAAELAERFAALAEASPLPTAQAALAYVRALLAPDAELDRAFPDAVDKARPQPFLHVRVLVAWAERLARVGHGADAEARLRAAREIAEAMGAPGVAQWVERTATALASTAPRPVDEPAAPATGGTVLRLLGRWELVVDGQTVAGPDGMPGRALRVLAVRGQVHVEELAELLWPESDPQAGRMRLRNVVSRLRSAVGPVVERRGELVALSPGVEVDADRFAELARSAHAAADAGDLDAATATAERAVALHAGPLLPDMPFADWALAPRERIHRLYVGLLDLLASTAEQRADVDAALALLERAAEEEPYDEERYLRAARICLDTGRRGTAAAMLERAERVAARLGVPADPRAADLDRRLRTGPAALGC